MTTGLERLFRAYHRPAEALWLVRGILNETVLVPMTSWLTRVRWRAWGVSIGPRLRVYGKSRLMNRGQMTIGRDVSLRSGFSNYVGGDRRLAMWVGRMGSLSIGDRCRISNTTIVCLKWVSIGEGTFIGGGCEIYDTDFHAINPDIRDTPEEVVSCKPVSIGARVFVGGWSIILKGVTVGDGAVIGAGSVVVRAVPPYEIWAGVPARCVGRVPRRTDPIPLEDGKVND